MKFSVIKKYIEGHSWVFAILYYNNKHNITLDVDHGILQQKRKNDKSIMSLASTYYTKVADLRAINRIRLSFQVHSLSEICSANGKYIMDEYFLNMRCDRICNPYDWPAKYRTSIKDYRVWRNLLEHLCHDNSRTLIYPLHTWVSHELDIWISDWDWFLSPDRSQLLHHCGDTTWKSYPLCRYSHYKYSRLDVTVVDPPVLELIRVSIQLTERFITISNTAIRPSAAPHQDDIIAFDAIELSQPTVNWFNTNMTSSASTKHLKECLMNGTALCVSDGSYFPIQEVGACGWIISTPDGTEWIEGGGVIPGLKSDQNSYRSELGSQLGIAAFISSVNFPHGNYTMKTVCDGLAALNRVGLDRSYVRCSSKHVV